MAMFWGVIPVFCPTPLGKTNLQEFIAQWAKQNTQLVAGAPFVMVTDTELLPGIHDSVLVARIA